MVNSSVGKYSSITPVLKMSSLEKFPAVGKISTMYGVAGQVPAVINPLERNDANIRSWAKVLRRFCAKGSGTTCTVAQGNKNGTLEGTRRTGLRIEMRAIP